MFVVGCWSVGLVTSPPYIGVSMLFSNAPCSQGAMSPGGAYSCFVITCHYNQFISLPSVVVLYMLLNEVAKK